MGLNSFQTFTYPLASSTKKNRKIKIFDSPELLFPIISDGKRHHGEREKGQDEKIGIF
jgi:hypothetical protein